MSCRQHYVTDIEQKIEGAWTKAQPDQAIETITFKPDNSVEWTYELDGKKYTEQGNYEVELSRNIYKSFRKYLILIITPTNSTNDIFLVNLQIDKDNRFHYDIEPLKFMDAFGHKYIFVKKE